jgi:hypothetical protein
MRVPQPRVHNDKEAKQEEVVIEKYCFKLFLKNILEFLFIYK